MAEHSAAINDDVPAPQSGSVDGRYLVGPVIGHGGLATVYRARDTLLNRDVAIKIFRARADNRDKLRLQEAEARLVASLNHYALTTLFDAGVDMSDPQAPQIYLIMENIPGADLQRWLEDGPLSPLQVGYLGLDLSEGLQYVHEHGFLHRDLKPANILLAKRGAETRIRGKLTDFGIASAIGTGDRGEVTIGTAAYLAPEQVLGEVPTPETDIYSLGLVLMEAVTARLEYPGSVSESAIARLDRDPTVPDTVPAALAAILTGMTRREPTDRISLAEATAAFQEFCLAQVAQHRNQSVAFASGDVAERDAAVRRYNVLDTPPDEAFDRLAHLATRLVGAPIAFVSVIDSERVFVKAGAGLDLRGNVPLDQSLCTLTVRGGEPWYVSDIATDWRTRDLDLPLDASVARSYAAAPLVTIDGYSIGSLCVYDTEPRDYTPDELADLAELAAIAVRELELRLATRRALLGLG
ncbi:GAF domain-containing serine/threonine-protein kinase [Amnibacterium flavum]|uniref:non-specific serine/threonine protein kinase n=1 Tax=Amnibacterium flavum TaxID=2173173 RepID=A0A2V1HT86_9MICO|nr:GAF domain-containing serine/threonine-protein kinase [Amnibacterium flavum]PVZ95551.1 serine/threonine protein kinase [Amnibacterium flavum]